MGLLGSPVPTRCQRSWSWCHVDVRRVATSHAYRVVQRSTRAHLPRGGRPHACSVADGDQCNLARSGTRPSLAYRIDERPHHHCGTMVELARRSATRGASEHRPADPSGEGRRAGPCGGPPGACRPLPPLRCRAPTCALVRWGGMACLPDRPAGVDAAVLGLPSGGVSEPHCARRTGRVRNPGDLAGVLVLVGHRGHPVRRSAGPPNTGAPALAGVRAAVRRPRDLGWAEPCLHVESATPRRAHRNRRALGRGSSTNPRSSPFGVSSEGFP